MMHTTSCYVCVSYLTIAHHLPGDLGSLETIDVYNNSMSGDVPPTLSKLLNLQHLYLAHEHLKPLRQRYCR